MRKIAFPITVFFAVVAFTASALGSGSVPPTNPNGWSAVPSTMADPACRPNPASQPAALTAPQQAVPASQGTMMPIQAADKQQMPQVAPPAAAPQQPRAQSPVPMPAASPQPPAQGQAPVSQANVMPQAMPVQGPAVQTPVAQPAQVQLQPIAHQQAAPARVGVPEHAAQPAQSVLPAQPAAHPAGQPQPAAPASVTPGQGGAASVPAVPAGQVTPSQQVQPKPALPAGVPSGTTGKVDKNATPAPRMAPGPSNVPADQGIAPQSATGSTANRRIVSPAAPQTERAAVPGAAREKNLNPRAAGPAQVQRTSEKCASCPSDRTVGTAPTSNRSMRPAPTPAPGVGQATAPSAKESVGATAGRTQKAADSRLDVRQPAGAASPGRTPQKAQQSRSCGSREPVDQLGQPGAQPVAPDSGANVMPQAVAPQQGVAQAPVAGPPAAVSPQAQQRVNWQNAPATAGAATTYPPQVSPSR